MADGESIRRRWDGSRMNLSEDYEVRYWSEKFGVSKQELAAAVKRVGPRTSYALILMGTVIGACGVNTPSTVTSPGDDTKAKATIPKTDTALLHKAM